MNWIDQMTHAERLRKMAPRIRQDGQVFGVALKIAEADAAIAGADALDELAALRELRSDETMHVEVIGDLMAETTTLKAEIEKLRAANSAKEDWVREWVRYANSAPSESIRNRLAKDIEARFFNGEFDSLRWLDDREKALRARVGELAEERDMWRIRCESPDATPVRVFEGEV